MEIRNNSTLQSTRYYLGGCYEKDVPASGSTTERLYIGGNAYSAPAVYIRTGSGAWTLHYIHRDHLGSITAITNSSGSRIAEYSFDPWGRQRNPVNQQAYAPDAAPSLLLGRGYTGHEHLPMFGLVNMNARLYDPVLGRFLSPDPYVQAPNWSQNFNRYSYCGNNPLIYTDMDGEFWHIIAGAVIGGAVNLVANWKNVDGFWDGLATFGVGAGAGALTAATGGAGASVWATAGVAAGGTAVTSMTNDVVAQTGKNFSGFDKVDWVHVGQSGAIGAVAGFASGAAGYWASNSSMLVNGIESPILRSTIVSPIAAGAGHVAGGTTANLIAGQKLGEAFANSFDGIGQSMAIGWATGVVATIGTSYAKGINPFTGKVINQPTQTSDFFEGTKYSSKVLGQMDNLEDPFHSFPRSVDGYANEFGNHYMKMGNDGHLYHHLEMSGNYMGKTGVFHFIKDSNGLINHRLFEVLQIK
jgi:RHS repeat-associated protein